jgi:exopolysaccharide production protein ExoQ
MTRMGVFARAGATGINWRVLEWWGAGLALFIFSGAVLPMILAPDGLTHDARARLQAVNLVAYAVTLVLLARHPRALRLALMRNLPFLALLVLPFVSVLWSISGSISLTRAIALTLSSSLAFLIAIRFTPRQFALLVALVMGPAIFASIALGIVAPGVANMPADEPAAGLRGVFVHKNVLGWYAALTLLVAIALIRDRAAPRAQALALAVASAACLLAANSATGLIVVAAAGALFLFHVAFARLRDAGRLVLLFLALAASLIFVVGFGALVAPALEALGRDPTLTGRTTLWRHVDAAIGRSAFVGFGYQAFWSDANPEAWRIRTLVDWVTPHAHNGYRDILLNFGLVGAAFFAWAMLRAVVQGALLNLRRPREGWLWLNVLLGAYLVMNATETQFLVQNEALSVVLSAALIMVGLRAPEARAPTPARGSP